jgi:hypothetical protein
VTICWLRSLPYDNTFQKSQFSTLRPDLRKWPGARYRRTTSAEPHQTMGCPPEWPNLDRRTSWRKSRRRPEETSPLLVRMRPPIRRDLPRRGQPDRCTCGSNAGFRHFPTQRKMLEENRGLHPGGRHEPVRGWAPRGRVPDAHRLLRRSSLACL